MINNIKKLIFGLAISCGVAAGFYSCTDTWNDHYESTADGVLEGSLWQAIQQRPELSNFASVVAACGYDKSLASSQVFTVFAPTNDCLSKAEADELIRQYNEEKGKVSDDENTVIKEFVQNHIALYNYSVSPLSNDSIVLMNGKYAVLRADYIDDSQFLDASKFKLYENGVLYTIGKVVNFASNVFEYVRKDTDLDSVSSFLYNPMFYSPKFQPSLSVPGGIENGKTVYLDSVFRQVNELFDGNFLSARLNSEDSTYWMVAPTNDVWRELVDEYSQYFVYDKSVENLLTVGSLDSLAYTNTRLAILQGTLFSRTMNVDAALQDSAVSTNAVRSYNLRSYAWGAPFNYYQYDSPLQAPYGVLSGTDNVKCSNGQIFKASQWNIDKLQTFHRYIIVEAETQGNIKEVSKMEYQKKDSVPTISPVTNQVSSNNAFYGRVWNNRFVEFEVKQTSVNHSVTFNITNVLSNVGYDIYLVTAPALANDSNATAEQRLPTILRCTLGYHNQDGATQTKQLMSSYTTKPDIVDYIKLADDFKFPVCTYGLNEQTPQVTLKVETRVSSSQLRNKTHNRVMRIDCVLLVPHGMLEVDDDLIHMYPHGKYDDRPYRYFTKRH